MKPGRRISFGKSTSFPTMTHQETVFSQNDPFRCYLYPDEAEWATKSVKILCKEKVGGYPW